MGRPRKNISTKELVEHAEEEVFKTKEAYDKAVSKLKELRDKQDKERQKELLDAIAKSKWNYEQIMEFVQKDPTEFDDE
ncbi:MAG: ErpK protein [Hungatella sp.]